MAAVIERKLLCSKEIIEKEEGGGKSPKLNIEVDLGERNDTKSNPTGKKGKLDRKWKKQAREIRIQPQEDMTTILSKRSFQNYIEEGGRLEFELNKSNLKI